MHLKRADVVCVSGGACLGEKRITPPSIWFDASDESYFCGRQIKKACGEIEFPSMLGWNIYSAERIGRYTIAVIFTDPPNPEVSGPPSGGSTAPQLMGGAK